jgi:hypothetical protein
MSYTKAISLLFLMTIITAESYSQTVIVPNKSSWKYFTGSSSPGATWKNPAFIDGGWASGIGELGYGDGDESTTVSYGPSSSSKYITTYFRKTVNIANPAVYSNFLMNITYDDGFVVYVNGTEAGRANMPAGLPVHSTTASSAIEDNIANITVPTSAFVMGDNMIAVEMHQASGTSTDISFDLKLSGNDAFSATLTRGPYLQVGSETAITIRWRTSTSQDSRIELGTSYDTYPVVVNNASSVTEHIVRVTGLTTDTKYYYRIGNSTNMGAPDPEKFFTTAPAANTTRKIRIAAFGDCGRGNSTYQDENLANYLNYLSTNSIDAPDAWILLGDNAYNSGTDADYSNNFFGIYGSTLLKNHKLYPSPGNHDYANNTANKSSRTMPYYSNFSVPQAAECGGVASGKPNFYSFDIGNIHFLSLDAWGIESDATHLGTSGTSMVKTWITADLAANTKKWTIAYWHHPPYTKTTHNSDTETELINIRKNFIGFLETKGVDLIINGHSHGYERSYLLRNFTTNWNTFTPASHAVSISSGMYTSSSNCPYVYNSTPANHGTVYVVAGSTGASGGVQTDFDAFAFPHSVSDGGVFYFEVEDNRLDAKMLRRNGTVFDQFTIVKDVNKNLTQDIIFGQSANLQASWPGTTNYSWSTGASTRSINVSPAVGTHNYSVTDNFGCLTDQFTVNVNSVLPVTLTRYNASLVREQVKIEWTTAAETNSKNFTVERSTDGSAFSPVEVIAAAGNSASPRNYTVFDKKPFKGTSYYRLVQEDIDGRTKNFEVKKIVNRNGSSFEMKLSQYSATLTVSVMSTEASRFKLNAYDVSGRLVYSTSLEVPVGSINRQLSLGKGSYVIHLINERGERFVEKVVVR